MIGKLWSALSGWKSVLGYAALQLHNPILIESFKKLMSSGFKDATAWYEFAGNILLAFGILHRVQKNLLGE